MTADQGPAPLEELPLEELSLVMADAGTGLRYDRLAEARRSCPVPHSAVHDLGVVTRYDDLRFVLENPDVFSSEDPNIFGRLPVRIPPLDSDPPLQQEFRRLLNPFFSRSYFARFEPDARLVARRAIDAFAERGSCELVSEFAVPFSAGVLAALVFDETDQARLDRALGYVTAVAEEQTHQAFADLAGLCAEYLAEKASSGSDRESLLGAIAHGRVDGRPLTQEEQVGVVTVLFLGGLDTTRGAIGNIAAQLATDPAIEDRLRDPGWVRHDLEEFIRLETPVITMARTVTGEVSLGGRVLQPGYRLALHFASANRDESRYPDADRLRFDRPRTGHAGFGLGIHRCIGMHFARFQIAIAFDELLARLTGLRPVDPGRPVPKAPGVVNGPLRLDVEFDRR